jgi:hypothetical protein
MTPTTAKDDLLAIWPHSNLVGRQSSKSVSLTVQGPAFEGWAIQLRIAS